MLDEEVAVAETVDEQAVDLLADREMFLAGIEKEKIRRLVDSLGPYPYNLPSLFPKTQGFGAAGEVKKHVKLLKRIEDRFDLLLYPGEQVEFVTQGLLNSWTDQYFLGWMVYLVNRRIFLFTNYRVIIIQAGGSYSPKEMQWQIPYDEITKFKAGGFLSSSMNFYLADKKKCKFAAVPSKDRKALRDYVTGQVERITADDFQFPHHASNDPLCPKCATPVPPKTYECETCQKPFTRPHVPAIMSLILPCAGDFYMRHYTIAALELLGYVAMWFVIAVLLSSGEPGVGPIIAIMLGFTHVVDALLTYRIASKGIMIKPGHNKD